jgi:dipeptidyl aminopeptidase/acylaminoacyl peptidase
LKHKVAVTDLAFSPDGRFIATASEDGTAVIWDIRTGQTVCDPLRHQFAVSAVRFTPDSLKIATASDSTAQVWDVATGAAITESLQHEKPITCLAFSSDGRTLVTGSADRTARIWDLAVDLTPTDRTYLAQFARALSTYALRDSGRLEMRIVDSRDRLRESVVPVTGTTRMLMDWFFTSPLDRPLTPFTSVTLRKYIGQRSKGKNDLPADEARFFSDESSSSR